MCFRGAEHFDLDKVGHDSYSPKRSYSVSSGAGCSSGSCADDLLAIMRYLFSGAGTVFISSRICHFLSKSWHRVERHDALTIRFSEWWCR